MNEPNKLAVSHHSPWKWYTVNLPSTIVRRTEANGEIHERKVLLKDTNECGIRKGNVL